MSIDDDHSRRIASASMSVFQASADLAVGRPAFLVGRLRPALEFNVGRISWTRDYRGERTAFQERLVQRAAAVGIARTRVGTHNRCDLANVRHWVQDAYRALMPKSAKPVFGSDVLDPSAFACNNRATDKQPLVAALVELASLADVRWVYLGLLSARVGEDEHGTLKPLAAAIYRGNSNLQRRLSVARRLLLEIEQGLLDAEQVPPGDPLTGLLGRLESHFDGVESPDPMELARLVAADPAFQPDSRASKFGGAFEALAVVAAYGDAQRQHLVAALKEYRRRFLDRFAPVPALTAWLDGLPDPNNERHPATAVLDHLRDLDVSQATAGAATAEDDESIGEELYRELFPSLTPGSWLQSLYLQVRADVRPETLAAWVKNEFSTAARVRREPGLANRVAERLADWREAARPEYRGNEKLALLFLEMPDGASRDVSPMEEARELLLGGAAGRRPKADAGAQRMFWYAVVSAALDHLSQEVRGCLNRM